MEENATMEGAGSALDCYRLTRDQIYFKSLVDLSYLVEAWRSLDVEQHPMMKVMRVCSSVGGGPLAGKTPCSKSPRKTVARFVTAPE